jgi:hypothetical protein
MASGFNFRGGDLAFNLASFNDRVAAGVSASVEYQAAVSEGMLKGEAPWTDRTGAARSGLHTDTDLGLRAWTLILAHSVSYGVWLETANNQQYAVILRVLVESGNQLMATLEGLFRRI